MNPKSTLEAIVSAVAVYMWTKREEQTYPGSKGYKEKRPLPRRHHPERRKGIRCSGHGRFEGLDPRTKVFGGRHAMVRGVADAVPKKPHHGVHLLGRLVAGRRRGVGVFVTAHVWFRSHESECMETVKC